MAPVSESDKALMKEYLAGYPHGTFDGFKLWLNQKDPTGQTKVNCSPSYIYYVRQLMYGSSAKTASDVRKRVKPKKIQMKQHKPKKHIKKMKPVIEKKITAPAISSLTDLTEVRRRLQEQNVTVEEHSLLMETWTKMRMLNPALSRMVVEEGPTGEPIWELRRVQVASGVG